ncbi:hypothetical protein JF50_19080 [Pseudoalteromonas luteoviolacea]|uniref:Uncharacterized protein n=1 Tax=Pseudoalteromonas luteoviolacea TaxID=43657 RepID=A0A0C1MP40_9GAMM|nr:hypothetical protein [Pseudoalteromonas luteoviolacea]KID56343.1 hypothetical protein JF50_19080 [Pseudoalteromonas luteoviolacea]
MKHYKCTNSICSEFSVYKEDKAAAFNYRCIACMRKLDVASVPYKEYKIAKYFERYSNSINCISAAFLACVTRMFDPSDFGGQISSVYLQFLTIVILFVFMQISMYHQILIQYENEPIEIENNLRPIKSFLAALFLLVLLSVYIIYTY